MRISNILAACFSAAFFYAAPAAAEAFKTVFPEIYAQFPDAEKAKIDSMDLQTGVIPIGSAAQLDVPQEYYFLPPKDARYILEEVWGNPEDTGVLGLIFPRKSSPFDGDAWTVVLSYNAMGYVSDTDAEGYDYDALLAGMKTNVRNGNDWRIKNGYDPIELIGWAEQPHYDKAERKLHWAKTLRFGALEGDILNYDIRALGRKGVMIARFVAGANQLADIKTAAPDVLKMISFTEGNRYADYLPGVDTVAAVGIGGLIAGKVVAKTGLLILALAYLKKGFLLVLLPLIWLKNKLFGGRSES